MELVALFTIGLSVDFSARFHINNKTYQDFFMFDGESSNAHLFRENDTISLMHVHRNNVSQYQINSTLSMIYFEWPGIINNEGMHLTRGMENTSLSQLGTFTLFDPILDSQPEGITESLDWDGALQNYLISFVIVLLLIIESPGLIKKLIGQYHTRVSSTLYSLDSSESV